MSKICLRPKKFGSWFAFEIQHRGQSRFALNQQRSNLGQNRPAILSRDDLGRWQFIQIDFAEFAHDTLVPSIERLQP